MTRDLAIQLLDNVQEQLASQDFVSSVAAAGTVDLERKTQTHLEVVVGRKVIAHVFHSADEPAPDAEPRLFVKSDLLPQTYSDKMTGGICTAVFGCVSMSRFS